jgi:ATP-dependent exoDNAse (exonuclease V) beta subunit
LSQILAEGVFKPKDIVLLSLYRDGSLGSMLAALPQWTNRIRPFRGDLDCIRYTTIHAFKGLEAPVVVLTDVDRF